jgi:CRP-like cAMP-binding protein
MVDDPFRIEVHVWRRVVTHLTQIQLDSPRVSDTLTPASTCRWGRGVRDVSRFSRKAAWLFTVARSGVVDTSRIAAFPVFVDLPAAELAELADAMSEVEIEAGAKVVTVDDYGTAIYFIEQGKADALTDGGESTQALGPGDAFGEIALILTGERTATVVARTPMRLLSLSG